MRGHNLLGCKFMEDYIFLISFVQLILPHVDLHQPRNREGSSKPKLLIA